MPADPRLLFIYAPEIAAARDSTEALTLIAIATLGASDV